MKILGLAGVLMMAVAATASAQKEQPTPKTSQPTEEQRPPKGMCRIWLKDVPAAQQPAPTDCASAVKNCPPSGKVIFGDTQDTKSKKTDPKLPSPNNLVGTKKPPVLIKPPYSSPDSPR
jgi:hypothetical protein